MNLELSEDQRAIRDMARRFATERLQPHAAKWDEEKHFPVAELRDAAALGFGGIYVKDDVGGSGLGRLDAANWRTSFEARQHRATPMPQLTILYWRDIPSQVVASAGRRNQAKVMLPDRFQEAIDRAAMRGGARDADGYLHEWRRAEPVGCGAELPAEAEAAARRQTGRASCGERVGQYG